MRFSLAPLSVVSLFIVSSLLAGCSSMSQEGGVFEDKSRAYVKAESLEKPINAGQSYTFDPLYPVPDIELINSGEFLHETPRVTSALMPLEQGAILLHKGTLYDRVLFAPLYQEALSSGIVGYIERRDIQLEENESNAILAELTSMLKTAPYISGKFVDTFVTQWTSADQFGYSTPGTLQKLFGADEVEHQYAYLTSKPNMSAETIAHTKKVLGDYTVQLHIAHRVRPVGSLKPSPWRFSLAEDDVLGLEMVNFVEDLKREVALASSGTVGDLAVELQQDGNALPYLSVSERFPIVWEALLEILPRERWKISDLDRSKGIMYLEVKNDDVLTDLKLTKFQLHLAEGPQVMILSVELSDEQPAGITTGRHVLEVIEKKFKKKVEGIEV